ncbi:MAG TPA: hypothetical protein VG755_24155, partial [Nannocystaceae bacterium]|nr:hypothetical protein [Nannocystaceae bacterium]
MTCARSVSALLLALAAACHGDSTHADGGGDGTTSGDASTGPTDPSTTIADTTVADESSDNATTGTDPSEVQIVLHFGDDVPVPVRERVVEHIDAVASIDVVVLDADEDVGALHPDSWILGFGDTPSTRALITADEVANASSETVIVRSGELDGIAALVTDAQRLDPDPMNHA